MNTQNQPMDVFVDIQNNCSIDSSSLLPDFSLLEHWVLAVLKHENISGVELTLRLVDEEEMRRLNNQYRQKNYSTNVLAFPAHIPSEIELEFSLLGDVVLSAPVIEKEAMEQKTDRLSHWAHMVIHGVLHLLGYDHIKEEEADLMEKKEVMILKQLNISNPYIDEA